VFLVLGFLAFTHRLYAVADDYAHLVGRYDMEIKIGEKVFHDILDIQSLSETDIQKGSFKGTLTVPGVFTADLEKTSYFIMFWAGIVRINFEIVAKENDKEFRVKYSAEKNNNGDVLIGNATLEDGSLLGTFTAIKNKEES